MAHNHIKRNSIETNRIVIGLSDTKEATKLHSYISTLGVPSDAITIKKSPPIKELLRNLRRPTGNGLQITSSAATCTLGINIRYWHSGHWTNAFLTNAHCTDDRYSVTGNRYSYWATFESNYRNRAGECT